MVLRFPMCIFQFFWYNERKYFLNFLYKSPIPHIPKYARVREEIRNSVKHRTGVGASVVNKI